MMITRENITFDKAQCIEQQILIFLSDNFEEYKVINEDTDEDIEFDCAYFMIEKELVTVNLNYYTCASDVLFCATWLYKKQFLIKSTELLDRLFILLSYE